MDDVEGACGEAVTLVGVGRFWFALAGNLDELLPRYSVAAVSTVLWIHLSKSVNHGTHGN